MQSTALYFIYDVVSMRSEYFPAISRESPIRKANAIGPARSPTALLTPSPRSANADAHCPTACSLAPAHTIMSINIQKSRLRKSPPTRSDG